MTTDEEMVEVRIQATERIEYCQDVCMPKATFDRLSAALDSDDRAERKRAQDEIEGAWVNTSDICSTDDFDLEEFGILKADA